MPLLQDDKDSAAEEAYEFEEGQEAVAKLVHLVKSKNLDLYFEILMKFKRIFVKGGHKRMRYTCPALIFALFRLSNEVINKQQIGDGYGYQEEQKAAVDEDELPIKLVKVD